MQRPTVLAKSGTFRKTTTFGSMVDSDIADSIARRKEAVVHRGAGDVENGRLYRQTSNFAVEMSKNKEPEEGLAEKATRYKKEMRHEFSRALQTFMLDHSTPFWSALSWACFAVFIIAIPALEYLFVTVSDHTTTGHQMPFAKIVLVLEAGEALIAYLTFWDMLVRRKENGDHDEDEDDADGEKEIEKNQRVKSSSSGSVVFNHATVEEEEEEEGYFFVIFVKSIQLQPLQTQIDYWALLENLRSYLMGYTWPFFILHLVLKINVYLNIPLNVVEITSSHAVNLGFSFVLTSLAWIYQTTTFFFVCATFNRICASQELIMENYMKEIIPHKGPGVCFDLYFDIIEGLCAISHRFRKFLALSGMLSLFGILASMYAVVSSADLKFTACSDLIVVNLVGLAGFGLCLVSASKIAHLHRRIVKFAMTNHAQHTYGIMKVKSGLGKTGKSLSELERNNSHGKRKAGPPLERVESESNVSVRSDSSDKDWDSQREWRERDTLVKYLQATTAGISVYGFVLDRTFVHTSFGALLTTTWFILGRSLGAIGTTQTINPPSPPTASPPMPNLGFPSLRFPF